MVQTATVDRSHRTVNSVPAQLLNHCTVCFEEQLYAQALSLLFNTLTSGTSSTHTCYIPPAQHLALTATLAVHPQLTTRTKSRDKQIASDEALRYLRHVNALVGPRRSGLNKAFTCLDSLSSSRTKRVRIRQHDIDHRRNDEDDQPGDIRSPYASKESLWNQAADFWSMFGWALNCSVVHKRRWDRWKLWLEFMLDVLSDDLAIFDHSEDGSDSMLAQYLSPIGEGRNNKRRLLRAILADGSHKSLAEFGEVWKNETQGPKNRKGDEGAWSSKRKKLDLENGEYGDYSGDDSDNGDSPQSREITTRSRSATAFPSRAASDDDEAEDARSDQDVDTSLASSPHTWPIQAYGGPDSIRLRQRLLALLFTFCAKYPALFVDTEDLLDLYTEFLRPLPLPVFQAFVLPSKPYLTARAQTNLSCMLLRPLLAATAPAYTEASLTAEGFGKWYAPFAANGAGAVDNAKCSLLIEGLLRGISGEGGDARIGGKLRKAVEKGIEARRARVAHAGRRRTGSKAKEEDEAVMVMDCSAERMMAWLELI